MEREPGPGSSIGRRAALSLLGGSAVAGLAGGLAGLGGCLSGCGEQSPPTPTEPAALAEPNPPHEESSADGATLRVLGRTGARVWPIALGGEGAMRTTGEDARAVPVIQAALDAGIRYCETAPAYQDSQRYYGLALRSRPGSRDSIFLASKTHLRDRESSLALLEETLSLLGTDHLDLWQIHDLRTREQLEAVFGPGGAMEAVEEAKRSGRIRFVGLTGHHDASVLVEAMRRYPFDTVLCPINPVDRVRGGFSDTVIAEARRRGMGVLGMKITGHGRILEDRAASREELVRYAASFADTCLVSCHSPEEVGEYLRLARSLRPMGEGEKREIEARLAAHADRYGYYAHP